MPHSLLAEDVGERWGTEEREREYYPIVNIPMPKDAVIEAGAFATLPDGRIAVGTRHGEIYFLDGIDAKKPNPTYHRFATGLDEIFGLAWEKDSLRVTQSCELTRVRDTNGDGVADRFETLSDDWGYANYHEYAFGSQVDREGNQFVALGLSASYHSHAWNRGFIMKVAPDGKTTAFASGLRSPGGIGFDEHDALFYVESQGPWNCSCSLKAVAPQSFHGHPASFHWYPYSPELGPIPEMPKPGSRIVLEKKRIKQLTPYAVIFPYVRMGRSITAFSVDRTGGKFGPFENQMFLGDYTQSILMRATTEQVNGVWQGACYPFREGISTGILNVEFTPEGNLVSGGTNRGWPVRGIKPFALERVEWSGKMPFEINRITIEPDGFQITFTKPVEPVTGSSPASYSISAFTHPYHGAYGGPEIEKKSPAVKKVVLAPDGLSAKISLEELEQGFVYEFDLVRLRSRDSEELLHRNAFYTVNEVPAKRNVLVSTKAIDENPLVPGEDRIDTPDISDGLCVHNLFQSNMVVQRDRPIPVWGWASPGEQVTVTLGEESRVIKAAADRTWKVEFSPMPASTNPRSIVVQGKDAKIELTNILVGDVWLLGGQSNMEFELHKVEEGPLEILSANFDQIRLFTVPQLNGPETKTSFPRQYQWNDFFSQHFRQGYWDVCTPESVRDMSGIGYVFGRRIHMATRVPIGIMDVSRGGTTLAAWTPIEVLTKINSPELQSTLLDWDTRVAEFDPQKDLERRIKQFDEREANLKAQGKPIPKNRKRPNELLPGPAVDMNRPGNLFAGTISTIAGLPVKGAIWHQGYNDALQPNGHKLYAAVFPEMIKAWRSVLNDPNMPFGIITQETQDQPQTLENFLPPMVDEGVYIREVHYQTFLKLRDQGDKNIGYASSFDQHRAWYHPQIKVPVGERIAKWALATQYGKSIRWLPPQLQECKIEPGKITLKLDTWAIPFHDGPIQGFAIAGKDGRFQPAKAVWLDKNEGKGEPNWERSTIVLSSELVPEPIYFRYAWARNPLENLKSSENAGLPFDTQRNDSFSLADMVEIYTGKKTTTPGVISPKESRELVQALQAEDKKRRFFEARKLLDEKSGFSSGR
ncbi:sialate O-acetylesterase [Pirellula sp. SH-Sr6A]|uniref:sialate O-acetylesterase n=1 Tax=Pirellula sp. SH-Sr6A TaxID=1632865 RepID=UPI00197C8B63|nr:sialate O-acetylesterase [Pirellula sp. SH-Sr6A]